MTNRKKPVLETAKLALIDALRDENEAYTRKLMQAGVNVAAARVLAAFHRLRHVECFGRYARSKAATQRFSRWT
jgi:acetyl esterase/lipase